MALGHNQQGASVRKGRGGSRMSGAPRAVTAMGNVRHTGGHPGGVGLSLGGGRGGKRSARRSGR